MVTLTMGGDEAEDAMASDDPFMQALMDFDSGAAFLPVEVDEQMLLGFRKEEVFVHKWPGGVPWSWFKNMVPEISLAQCGSCNHFFHDEEWEAAVLAKEECPFCRSPQTAD
ncbi:hypothetical protein T492DRAFT_870791 [Pavlovales sp. CCMP2436]|nr:hypothetical protein T492DRAFT_870791 [Pavlovales sp. CCMP2436]